MQIIELDASGWNTFSDYLEALKNAIRAPEGHGSNIDAFRDSMIWGGMNALEPPYTIRVRNLENLPPDILDELKTLQSELIRARGEYLARRGYDVDVQIELVPLLH
jgi:hypothetical protein